MYIIILWNYLEFLYRHLLNAQYAGKCKYLASCNLKENKDKPRTDLLEKTQQPLKTLYIGGEILGMQAMPGIIKGALKYQRICRDTESTYRSSKEPTFEYIQHIEKNYQNIFKNPFFRKLLEPICRRISRKHLTLQKDEEKNCTENSRDGREDIPQRRRLR